MCSVARSKRDRSKRGQSKRDRQVGFCESTRKKNLSANFGVGHCRVDGKFGRLLIIANLIDHRQRWIVAECRRKQPVTGVSFALSISPAKRLPVPRISLHGIVDLKASVEKLGGVIENGPAAERLLNKAGKPAAFIGNPDGSFVLRLRPDATVREVAHEMGHAVTFITLRPRDYGALKKPLREYLAMQYAVNQNRVGRHSIVGRHTELSRIRDIGIRGTGDLDQFITGPNQDRIKGTVETLLKDWDVKL